MPLLVAGSLQEQAGEKLDRLGLLSAAEAGKPRAAEPKLGIAQNNLPHEKRRRPDAAAMDGAASAKSPLY